MIVNSRKINLRTIRPIKARLERWTIWAKIESRSNKGKPTEFGVAK